MRFYRVGGAVRDRLLGRAVQDHDWVVVGATSAQMLARGFKRVGADFPVFLHPETGDEYALARTERKSGAGYKGFTVHANEDVSLEQDLQRRDLTINAMAEDESGTLIDPYGGQRDLERRILRHVSPAFVEDPLRVLRVARFAARFDYTVAPETLALMTRMSASGELADLIAERVWSELQRALGEPRPDLFISTLRDCGALAALFPWIDRLFGIPQPPRYHPEIDTGVHILLALRTAADHQASIPVRFAVLVHDLGKGTTPAELLPRHIGHEQRGVALIEELCDAFKAPRDYRELGILVARLHSKCHHARQLRAATAHGLLEEIDAFRRPRRFEDFLRACELDYLGRAWTSAVSYPQADYLRRLLTHAAQVSIQDLLERGAPGTQIAATLRERRIAALLEITGTQSG